MAVQYISHTTIASVSITGGVEVPAGTQTHDLLTLVLATRVEAPSVPSGWVLQDSLTANGNSPSQWVWTRLHDDADLVDINDDPEITTLGYAITGGSYPSGALIAWRGAAEGVTVNLEEDDVQSDRTITFGGSIPNRVGVAVAMGTYRPQFPSDSIGLPAGWTSIAAHTGATPYSIVGWKAVSSGLAGAVDIEAATTELGDFDYGVAGIMLIPEKSARVRSSVSEDTVKAQRFTIGDGTSTVFTINRSIPTRYTGHTNYFVSTTPLGDLTVMKYILSVNVYDTSFNKVSDYSTSENASEYVITFDSAPKTDSRVVIIKYVPVEGGS